MGSETGKDGSRQTERTMKQSIAFFTILLMTATGVVAAELPVANVIETPGPQYADNVRFWQGIPGIERASNGRLWVTWYSGDTGEGEMGNYAMLATSDDDGASWSNPIVVIEGPKGTRIGDPLPWIDPKGRLWIFWYQLTERSSDSPVLKNCFAIRTDDPDCAEPKWSKPFLVAEGGILFGKPVVRAGGGWVAPFFINGKPSLREKVNSKETGTLLSTNEGASWQWLGGTSIPKDLRNFSEATLAQRKDGSLLMVIRTQKGLYESISKDDGCIWSDAMPMAEFAGPVTRACVKRLASGAFLLIYHDSLKAKPARERLTVWLSDDEGRTWPHKLLIDERNRVSYPDAVQAIDGRIFITYDYGRYEFGEKEILVSILREDDVRAGRLVSQDARLKLVVNQAAANGNVIDLRRKAASQKEKNSKRLPVFPESSP